MKTYVFEGVQADEVTVEATNESDARRRAMIKKWGPFPQSIGKPPCQIEGIGYGLSLIKVIG